MKRHGPGTVQSPAPGSAYWRSDGKRHQGDPEQPLGDIDASNRKLMEPNFLT
jgi:hypothetical protein